MSKVPPYCEYLVKENYKKVDPLARWRSGLKLRFDKQLVDIASLVTGTASTSGLERCFSTLGLTCGKLHAQMGFEKAEKLAFLFRQLNCR